MINRIRTRWYQLQDQGELRRMLRQAAPTTRAGLWAAADRYLSLRDARAIRSTPEFPPSIRWTH